MKLDSFQRQVLLAILIVSLPFFQLLSISLKFDAYTLVMHNTESVWQNLFGYFGQFAKVCVLFVFIFVLVIKDRLLGYAYIFVNQVTIKRVFLWLAPQLGAYFLLYRLSYLVFAPDAPELSAFYYMLWLAAVCACVLFSMVMFAPKSIWHRVARREWLPAIVALGVSSAVWLVSTQVSGLWGPMSEYTFLLVAVALLFINEEQLYVDIEEKVIGLGDFAVNIAPACSGYEGIGLITAFTAIYLYLYKQEFRFPRAYLLFFIGALAIWLLNAVRITVLILIGSYWSPEIAVGGFHSQAGWITFISTSLALLWLAKKMTFFTVPPVSKSVRVEEKPIQTVSDNADTAIATLVPMVVLLTVILISSAISAGFDWLYPVRVLTVIAALVWASKFLQWRPYSIRLESVGAGVFVALVWMFMLVGSADESNAEFASSLWSIELGWAYLWLFIRFIGSVITVPIAEELAFRAYILCKFSGTPVNIRGVMPVSVVAVLVSSLMFGALHGAWLAGTIAGIVYAIVRLRSDHLGDAIVAHAVTNAILFMYALSTGEWVLI